MNLWYDYRTVWAAYPLLAVYFVIVLAVLGLSIYGTISGRGPLMILFIPALGALYVHHLLVMKRHR